MAEHRKGRRKTQIGLPTRKGYLDAVTSSGYVEGWAYDSATPLDPLTVAVLNPEQIEIAWGIANQYREDLAVSGCGTGWCAFRLRIEDSVNRLEPPALTLVDRGSGTAIATRHPVPLREDDDQPIRQIANLFASDPTTLQSVDQLQGCKHIFAHFVDRQGVEDFVRAAYGYLHARSADAVGLSHYATLVRESAVAPYDLLVRMADSDEFRSRARLLAAPHSMAFPFR
jgi:hypothetical protein